MRQLVTTLPGCLSDHVAALVPGVDKALKDNTSNHLRIEALVFLQLVLARIRRLSSSRTGTLPSRCRLSLAPASLCPDASPSHPHPSRVHSSPTPPALRSRSPAPPFVPPPLPAPPDRPGSPDPSRRMRTQTPSYISRGAVPRPAHPPQRGATPPRCRARAAARGCSQLIALVDDRYYKITCEALRVCSEIIRVMRPDPPAAMFDFKPHVAPLVACAKARLLAQDQDQEVKECAITCMGLALCHLGDACAEELPTVLPILLDRLRNEITRITAVKAFAALAAAKLDMQLGAPLAGGTVLHAAVAELCAFLRKSNRPLRQASLTALTTIVSSHHSQLSRQIVEAMLEELPAVCAVASSTPQRTAAPR